MASSILNKKSPDGRWTITGPMLGSGSYGEVYVGVNNQTGEPVAIKRFNDEDYFEDELKVAEALNCAAFATCVLDEFELGRNNLFIVYRKAEMDAQQWLKERGALLMVGQPRAEDVARLHLSDEERYAFVSSMLLSLNSMIGSGVVHRDIKLANILVYRDKETGKYAFGLGDLGTVCAYGGQSTTFPKLRPCNLDSNFCVTTYLYAPKHIFEAQKYRSKEDQKWVDIYGTASCIFAALTGTVAAPSFQPSYVPIANLFLPDGRVISGQDLYNFLMGMMFSKTYKEALNSFRILYLAVFNQLSNDGSMQQLHEPIRSKLAGAAKIKKIKKRKRKVVKRTKRN